MTATMQWFDGESAGRLLAVLAHSLWQAPLIAGILWVALRAISAKGASIRYTMCLVAMTGILVTAAGTWTLLEPAAWPRVGEMRNEVVNHQGMQVSERLAHVAGSLRDPESASKQHQDGAIRIDSEATRNTGMQVSERLVHVAGSLRDPESASKQHQDGAIRVDSESHENTGMRVSERLAYVKPFYNHWRESLLGLWLLGVCVMWLRIGRSLMGTSTLLSDGIRPPEEIVRLVEQTRRQMRIARRVAVVASERIALPGVFGIVWPTLILPVSMLSGVPPEELRAVLAHELTHVRRWDFAVNLVQMLIESLFFFNPAVWWIGRRLRIEREASADAAVVRLTGNSFEYASLLADLAEKTPLGASPAFVGLGDGPILERIKRLLNPAAAPGVRLPWSTLCVWLLLSGLAVAALWQGTTTVVGVAKKLLTDEERVETIETAQEQFAPQTKEDGAGEGTICGTVRTEDGKEASKVSLHYLCEGTNYQDSHWGVGGDFRIKTPGGMIRIVAWKEGYAPTFAGPYRSSPGRTIKDVKIVLRRGFDAAIRVEDPEGRPVEGATVRGRSARYYFGPYDMIGVLTTNDKGLVQAAHLADTPYKINIRAAGFQETEETVSMSPRRTAVIRLKKAEPFVGRVLSVTGEPVTDAKVRLIKASDGSTWHDWMYDSRSPVETDQSGRFELDELNDTCKYGLRIESDRWGRALVQSAAAGEERKITLGPKLTVRGTIAGPLDELDKRQGKPYVTVVQPHLYQIGSGKFIIWMPNRVFVREEDGTASFEDSALIPGKVTVRAGGREVETTVGLDAPTATVRIDLNRPVEAKQPEHRPVVLRFARDGKNIVPEGNVTVWGFFRNAAVWEGRKIFPISDGTVTFDIPVSGKFQCKPGDIVGWSFDEVRREVEPGKGPLEVEVPVIPAGALKGRILVPSDWAGGHGAAGHAGEFPSVSVRAESANGNTETIDASVDMEYRYFATPVPLGAECTAKLTWGRYILAAPRFELSAADPIREIDLKLLAEPVSPRVLVTDPDDRPLSNIPVSLEWRRDGYGGNLFLNVGETDRKGRLTIRNVNPDCPQYYVRVDFRRTWQPACVKLRTDGKETHVRLQRGKELSVTVLDDATGRPIPGIAVWAYADPAPKSWPFLNRLQAEAATDQNGKCRFSNLPDREVRLDSLAVDRPSGEDWKVDVSRQKEVVIRGKAKPSNLPW